MLSGIKQPVEVYVYDLTKGLARNLSDIVLGQQIDAVYHTGVCVYGREYTFGRAGILTFPPKGTLLGEPETVLKLQSTSVPEYLFRKFLDSLHAVKYKPGTYDLFVFNCNVFSEEVVRYLTGESLPKYVMDLPLDVINTPRGKMLRSMYERVFGTGGPGQTYNQNSNCGSSKFEGLNHSRFLNGAVYDGNWGMGKKNGEGLFVYPDSTNYQGGWLDDQRSGFGVYHYSNGDVYEGEWKNHMRHGHGKYTYASSKLQYSGEWSEGQRVGEGEVIQLTDEQVVEAQSAGYTGGQPPSMGHASEGEGMHVAAAGSDGHEVHEDDRHHGVQSPPVEGEVVEGTMFVDQAAEAHAAEHAGEHGGEHHETHASEPHEAHASEHHSEHHEEHGGEHHEGEASSAQEGGEEHHEGEAASEASTEVAQEMGEENHEGAADTGEHHEGEADVEEHHEGEADVGEHHEGAVDAGEHHEGESDTGEHHEVAEDAGEHHEEAFDAGEHHEEASDAGGEHEEGGAKHVGEEQADDESGAQEAAVPEEGTSEANEVGEEPAPGEG